MEKKELKYYETKVKSFVPDEKTGKMKSKTFVFCYKTFSFGDAENRASAEMIDLGWSDHEVTGIVPTKIVEHNEFKDKDPDIEYKYFKFRIDFEDEDLSFTNEILVEQKDITDAKKFVESLLSDSALLWKISKLEETKIISVNI